MTVLDNIYTLKIQSDMGDIMVANRYMIDTQENLDFIILNGRAGVLFMPFTG